MYNILFSDLDETLLDHNGQVPEINQQAIEKMQKKDKLFVIATGRSYNMIYDIQKQVHTYNCEKQYSLCFNGGLVIENKDNHVLYFQGLDKKDARILFDEGQKRGLCMLVFTMECCYIFNADAYEVERKKNQKAPYKVMTGDLDDIHEDIAKMLLMKRDMDYLKDLKASVEPKLAGRVALSFSSYRYMECNAAGVSKGAGLSFLCDYLKIPVREAIAIGDNYNDISMIQKAGLGACVASSHEDIKQVADYVCAKDYAEGAVAEVIEKFMGGENDGL